MTKICTCCKEEKPLDEYYNSKAYKDGKGYRCKSCDAIARRNYEERHRERRRENMRKAGRKFKYGITDEQFQRMWARQDGKCGICLTDMGQYTGGRPHDDQLCIDHCHTTSRVRGLLCHRCNRGLGMFKDDPKVLLSAYKYLEEDNAEIH